MNTLENWTMTTLGYTNTVTKKQEEELQKQFTEGFAERLKKVRKEKKMTQEELAFEAGLNSAYISHLERGVYSPTLYVVWKITQALGVSLNDFLVNFP